MGRAGAARKLTGRAGSFVEMGENHLRRPGRHVDGQLRQPDKSDPLDVEAILSENREIRQGRGFVICHLGFDIGHCPEIARC